MDLAKLIIGMHPGPSPAPASEGPEAVDPVLEMAAKEVLAAIEKKDAKRLARSLRAFHRVARDA